MKVFCLWVLDSCIWWWIFKLNFPTDVCVCVCTYACVLGWFHKYIALMTSGSIFKNFVILYLKANSDRCLYIYWFWFEWMNEWNWKCIDLKCVWKPTKSQLSLTPCKQIQLLSRIKTLNGPRVHGISLVGKEKVYRGRDLPKSQVLSSEWNSKRVRDDASGDCGEGEGDELPCVIGERAGDCVWRGSSNTSVEYKTILDRTVYRSQPT